MSRIANLLGEISKELASLEARMEAREDARDREALKREIEINDLLENEFNPSESNNFAEAMREKFTDELSNLFFASENKFLFLLNVSFDYWRKQAEQYVDGKRF